MVKCPLKHACSIGNQPLASHWSYLAPELFNKDTICSNPLIQAIKIGVQPYDDSLISTLARCCNKSLTHSKRFNLQAMNNKDSPLLSSWFTFKPSCERRTCSNSAESNLVAKINIFESVSLCPETRILTSSICFSLIAKLSGVKPSESPHFETSAKATVSSHWFHFFKNSTMIFVSSTNPFFSLGQLSSPKSNDVMMEEVSTVDISWISQSPHQIENFTETPQTSSKSGLGQQGNVQFDRRKTVFLSNFLRILTNPLLFNSANHFKFLKEDLSSIKIPETSSISSSVKESLISLDSPFKTKLEIRSNLLSYSKY
ncbi:hypothetical protein WICPIJ_007377 [Wickerhamomyces pijperi]|uniref:Uncharacterized protein n=1 Tax=Wickerhamomyces pijperi TaxID=599730 RepID=A0A9P8TKH5_WICPI|nr:hypothetical protein WICPIJ_007377 [Wickerhamomyces pijperi]